jgi:hypothetical protein
MNSSPSAGIVIWWNALLPLFGIAKDTVDFMKAFRKAATPWNDPQM